MGYIRDNDPVGQSHHRHDEWMGNIDELKVGTDVVVNYCPYPYGAKWFARHEKVVAVTEDEFVTETIDGSLAEGNIRDVFPYTPESQQCI